MSDDNAGKSPLSPSKLWSPHSAALHRRRKMGENSKAKILGSLGGLALGGDDDDDADIDLFDKFSSSDGALKFNPNPTKHGKIKSSNSKGSKSPGSNSKRSVGTSKASLSSSSSSKLSVSQKLSKSKQKDAEIELKEALSKVSPEIRAKLAKVFHPQTPMKERLEIEVAMMNITEERKILSDFKWKVERKHFNLRILETIESQQELLDRNLAEEAMRSKAEQEELAQRRQEKIEAEIAKKERELEVKRQVTIHKAKNIAEGAEELRKEAEKTAEAAKKNKQKKEKRAKEREAKVQAFINGPGQSMTHVERELKIARMINSGEI